MAVKNAIFLFEVVVESVKSYVDSRFLVIRSDFADIFSLELKDPKQMHIVIPEPPPLPPEPVGKKGKKKKKPKPKKKKGKKGKKGAIVLPPPEPAIQSGQSILFPCSAEVLIQNMKKYPMEVSLWSKEDNTIFIGASIVPWDPIFLTYLEKIADCENPPVAPSVKDEYNVFQEGTAKLMARLGLQVTLKYLTEKITASFRTLTEDENIKRVLYTGMNSKKTSFLCNYKTTDEVFQENCNKVENSYIKSIESPAANKPMVYADYKNAPGANLAVPDDGAYCCLGLADKPPDDKYKSPETCPDIDFICDYVRKIITSCNDNMRMLTPRPTIRPRAKATDIDKLCYCRETSWPPGSFAQRFRHEVQSAPCPLCREAKATRDRIANNAFDIANIRGLCGKPDCRIARDIRAYIERLHLEDNVVIDLNDIIGPCGSKSCTLAEKIQECLRKQGDFKNGATLEGLSTQCACVEQMQQALFKRTSCTSVCSKDCSETGSDESRCDGKGCPFKNPLRETKVYQVYYFTVEYEFENKNQKESQSENQTETQVSQDVSRATSPGRSSPEPRSTVQSSEPFKYCGPTCPSRKSEPASCSRSVCSTLTPTDREKLPLKCENPVCPSKDTTMPPSPADSDIVVRFDDIRNPCCVKTCEVAEKVKDFIAFGKTQMAKKLKDEDPCYCDCDCTLRLSNKTRYCAVCGGFEFRGDDMDELPEYARPHPCPVYHKMYDKRYIQVESPFPEKIEELKQQQAAEVASVKSSKTVASRQTTMAKQAPVPEKKDKKEKKSKKPSKKKKVGKFTTNANMEESPQESGSTQIQPDKKSETKPYYYIPPVPGDMGWLWNAEDIPGLKVRTRFSNTNNKIIRNWVNRPCFKICYEYLELNDTCKLPLYLFRPNWRPGAAHKVLVRKYKTIREGADVREKKKQALLNRKKKIEMKPTLVVTKADGEYTVQMEVFRKYSKERMLFQYPYDEKPPLIYTIGKTEEEKIKLKKQRERRERRETRRKSRLIQSTFRDKCQEICLKAYNQAMGLLPLPNLNNPECPCDLKENQPLEPPIDSCSCSEEGTISSSDTDNDEWIIEFTPPMARWDPKVKHAPNHVDNESQYNYLDYKLKVLDKQGNAVPRFFKGPDGNQECSDLGGFWGPGHQWLEINKDGWIGPDGRWVPLNFVGPDGMFYMSEDGVFIDNTGKSWKIGVDGYIEKDGKWTWYSKKREKGDKSISTTTGATDKKKPGQKSESPVSTKSKVHEKVGTTSSKGHLPTQKDAKGKKTVSGSQAALLKDKTKGKQDKKQVSVQVKSKGPVVINVGVGFEKKTLQPNDRFGSRSYQGNSRVRNMRYTEHNKYIDSKLSKYREIMNGLLIYDDLCDPIKHSVPFKANRAVNTPRRKISPFTIDGCCYHPKQQIAFSSTINESVSEISQAPLIL